jgi:hypothetical protein
MHEFLNVSWFFARSKRQFLSVRKKFDRLEELALQAIPTFNDLRFGLSRYDILGVQLRR